VFKNCFTLCVDMDDTIENLLAAWLTWLNNKYKTNVQPQDVKDWEIQKTFPYLTEEQILEPLSKREFWKTVTPKEDAIYYLQRLIDEGQDVYIVTASHFETFQYKIEEVLLKYFPMIDPKKIICLYQKSMLKCDIMIDDHIENLRNNDCYKFLLKAPYNENIDLPPKCKYVNDWKEIYDTLKILDWIYTCENKKTILYN